MTRPIDIIFRNVHASQAVASRITAQVQKLEQFCDRITDCRVIIDAPHQKQHKGKHYQVQIELNVPNGKIVVNRHPEKNSAHSNLYIVLRDAFAAARRQLQAYTAIRAS